MTTFRGHKDNNSATYKSYEINIRKGLTSFHVQYSNNVFLEDNHFSSYQKAKNWAISKIDFKTTCNKLSKNIPF